MPKQSKRQRQAMNDLLSKPINQRPTSSRYKKTRAQRKNPNHSPVGKPVVQPTETPVSPKLANTLNGQVLVAVKNMSDFKITKLIFALEEVKNHRLADAYSNIHRDLLNDATQRVADLLIPRKS